MFLGIRQNSGRCMGRTFSNAVLRLATEEAYQLPPITAYVDAGTNYTFDGGITLDEGWQSRVTFPNGKYRLSLSADGKRLMLEHFNGTIFAIR